MDESKAQLPGEDLITKGLQDLRESIPSVEALLVLIGAPRLRRQRMSISDNKIFDLQHQTAASPDPK